MDMTDNETNCCPRFDAPSWDKQTFVFDDMLFAKASTKNFLHMPLNLGKVMTNTQAFIEKAGATEKDFYLVLSQDVSSWKTNHYFKVTKDVSDLEMVKLSGTYMTRTYDAKYKDIPNLLKEFESYISDSGSKMREFLVFYTTCPKCAKHYGHNYMVFFGKI
jgi:hypothetical protein